LLNNKKPAQKAKRNILNAVIQLSINQKE